MRKSKGVTYRSSSHFRSTCIFFQVMQFRKWEKTLTRSLDNSKRYLQNTGWTVCYRKSVLHLFKWTWNMCLSRCSIDLRYETLSIVLPRPICLRSKWAGTHTIKHVIARFPYSQSGLATLQPASPEKELPCNAY